MVDGVSIRTGHDLENADGIDLDSCAGADIEDCDINSGDDAFCLKATSTIPCRDISARRCKISTRNNGIKLGTESIGDFQNILISNCEITHAGMCGVAIYGVDGGEIHDVSISDLTIDNTSIAVAIRLGARLKTFRPGDRARPVGIIRNIAFHAITATHIHSIGMLINGIPDHPVQAVTFDNIRLELPEGGSATEAKMQLAEKINAYPEFNMFGKVMPAAGFYIRHARAMTFKDIHMVTVNPSHKPMSVLIDTEAIFSNALTAQKPGG